MSFSPRSTRPLLATAGLLLGSAGATAEPCAQSYEKVLPYSRQITADQAQIDLHSAVTLRYDCTTFLTESAGGIDTIFLGARSQLINAVASANAGPTKTHVTTTATVLGFEIARDEQDVSGLYHQTFKPAQDLDLSDVRQVQVGPLLVPVRFGLQGTSGVDVTVAAGELGVVLDVVPTAKLGAYVEASADVQIVQASAKGDLLLVDGYLGNHVSLHFSPAAAGQAPSFGYSAAGNAKLQAFDGVVSAHLVVQENGAPKSYDQELMRWPGMSVDGKTYDQNGSLGSLPSAAAFSLLARQGATLLAADQANANRQIDRAVTAGLDEGQLLSLMRQQGGQGELSQDLYLKMKAWVSLHPESLAALVPMAMSLEADDPRLSGLIKACGAVGSPAAQAALRDLASHQPSEVIARILTTLGLVKQPDAATVSFLTATAEHSTELKLKERATLAAGIAASRLRLSQQAGDHRRAAQLEQRFGAWLAAPSDDATHALALGALGNMGPSHLGQLSASLASPSPQLRGAAYFALRFAPNPSASTLLARGYAAELARVDQDGPSTALVRGQIARSLSQRQPDRAWVEAVRQVSQLALAPGDAAVLVKAVSKADQIAAVQRQQLLSLLTVATP